MGRHQLRYWNGTKWTEHVSNNDATAIDHLDGAQPVSTSTTAEHAQVAGEGVDVRRGDPCAGLFEGKRKSAEPGGDGRRGGFGGSIRLFLRTLSRRNASATQSVSTPTWVT